ncbi:MAG TPA: FAD:protein FMN transferase [Candidatus Dormibacteraeota bacterium]|nr:FAD:protein FMN transferase [Candidatus Dormibacteraeota bacterium]
MSVAAVDGRALGTSLRVVATDAALLDAARRAVDRVVDEIDATCSRFREDSEISALHRRAGREVRVSPLLMQALRAALRGARLSGGAVDPTVGSAVRRIGYEGDFATVARDGAPLRLTVTPVPGWRQIRLDAGARSAFIPEGVELDLGSSAKALAADLAAAAAHAAMGAGGVLVSLGGDIAVAGSAPEGGWVIQAAEDSNAAVDDSAESIAIRSGGVATSSTTVRAWRRGGVALHHIVDPATGLPVQGPWRTVTVVAADCLDANIAATGAIVRGEAALAWLGELGLPSRLVTHAGEVVRVAGWPAPAGVALG